MKGPPAWLLLVQDVVFLLVAGVAHGTGAWAAWSVASLVVSTGLPWLLGVPPALVAYAVVSILIVGGLDRLVPAVKAGRHAMGSPAFMAWGVHLVLYRVLRLQPLALLIRYTNALRFLWLRILRTRAAFTAQLSGDVNLLDHQPLTLGAGCVVGAECTISTHFVFRGELLAAGVHIGEGALVGARCGVLPGVHVGAGAVVHGDTHLGLDVVVGDRARVGFSCQVATGARIGEGAVLEPRSYVAPGTVIPAGERWGGAPAQRVEHAQEVRGTLA